MSGMTGPDPLKAIRQLHLQRADIARQPPLQISFNAASLSPHLHFLPRTFRVGHRRLSACIGLVLSTHFKIDDDWLSEYRIDFFAAIHFI